MAAVTAAKAATTVLSNKGVQKAIVAAICFFAVLLLILISLLGGITGYGQTIANELTLELNTVSQNLTEDSEPLKIQLIYSCYLSLFPEVEESKNAETAKQLISCFYTTKDKKHTTN